MLFIPLVLGIIGLGVAYYIYTLVLKYSEGEDKIKKIGDQIHLGAMVFMRSEYQILAMFAAVLLVLLFIFLGWKTALAFARQWRSVSSAGDSCRTQICGFK